MNISMKWRPALAGVMALAVVGGGATAANAAADPDILNPQSNGSVGSFYIWSNDTAEMVDDGRAYGRFDSLIIATSKTDVLAEIPAPPAGTWTQAYKFVAKASEMAGGTGSWRAYSPTFAAGPGGGILTDDFTLGSKINQNGGGIETVFTEGGDWYAGVAFTTNNGVTPVRSVYRTIHVNAANDTFTVDPVEVVHNTAPMVTTQPTSVSVTQGGDATFTAAASGTPAPTIQWQSSADGEQWTDVAGATNASITVSAATLAQSGLQYRAVFINVAGTATTNAAQLTVNLPIVEPTDAANAATKKSLAAPIDGKVTIPDVPVGTYNAYGWSTPTNLGSVEVGASGDAVITIPSALQNDATHTFALLKSNNEIVAWGSVLVPAPPSPPSDPGTLPDPPPAQSPQPAADEDLTADLRDQVSVVGSAPVAGGPATIQLGSDYAGKWVSVWLHSTPTDLGWHRVTAAGTVSVTLPSGVTGAHRIVALDVSGAVIGWTAVTIAQPPIARASSALATTGQDGTVAAWAGVLALTLIVGGVAIRSARRRA